MPDGIPLYVIISTQSREPTTFDERAVAFEDMRGVRLHSHHDNAAPQHPKSVKEWNYWKQLVETTVASNKVTHFFASEPYGKKMADLLGCEFIPVDLKRLSYPVKGSSVRASIPHGLNIEPKFKRKMNSDLVLFGAESVGKTTLVKNINDMRLAQVYPEWARDYLEQVGSEPTPERLYNIVLGQSALERQEFSNKFCIRVFDTDLLTTLGYYRLNKIDPPQTLINNINAIRTTPRQYLVLPTDIPFKPDQLRYGGDKRESTTKFWTDLLEEFNRPYTIFSRRGGIIPYLKSLKAGQLNCTFKELVGFKRA
jgi:nicotinamide riboside kinase